MTMTHYTDPALIAWLRAARVQGARTAAMLRALDARGMLTIEMMDAFREAFGLDSYAVAPIGGWFADGAGELDDDAVSALVDAAIAEQESRGQGDSIVP